ncbi:MAG: hypothetical protein ACI9JM_000179 [Halioglobus sp.]|jgi:hypothetical protein
MKKYSNTIGISVLHIFVLCAFAISQPLYDMFSRQAEFFVARQAESTEILLFIVLVSLLLPLPFIALSALSAFLGEASRRLVHHFLMAVLVALFCIIAINQNSESYGYLAVALSIALALVFVQIYQRLEAARQVISLMSISILVFPLLFLFSSNIQVLLASGEAERSGTERANSQAEGLNQLYPPVVMLVFDELALTALLNSSEMIDAERFPNIAALASTSSWYRNATTVVPVTNYAVPAIVTGRYPSIEALPITAYYPQSLFTLLADTHESHVIEPITRLCPLHQCVPVSHDTVSQRAKSLVRDVGLVYAHMVTPDQFVHHLLALGHRWGGFIQDKGRNGIIEKYKADEEQIRKAIRENIHGDRMVAFNRFLEGLEPATTFRPPLYFLHLLLPHTPWQYYPSGSMYSQEYAEKIPGMDTGNTNWQHSQWLADQGYQRYMMQVELLDKLLGEIIDKLKENGLFERSLIVFTADHGAHFEAGTSFRELSEANLSNVLPIPLFIKKPGQIKGEIDDSNVQITDIFPTLAELLGMSLEKAVDGEVIGSAAIRKRDQKRYYDFFSLWGNKPVDIPAYISGRSVAVARKIALFGEGAEGSLYNIGVHRDLLGKSVNTFALEPVDLNIEIEQAPFLVDVGLSASLLPGFITGTIEGQDSAELDSLVIAVNGVLTASTEVFIDRAGKRLFTAILPEHVFMQGGNIVEAYGVDRGSDAVVLRSPANRVEVIYQIKPGKEGGYIIEGTDGSVVPIVGNTVIGSVDKVDVKENSIEFSGWALDEAAGEVAARLVLFRNGVSLYSTSHSGEYRPDMEKHYGLPLAGYRFTIPVALLPERNRTDVRVLGVSAKGVATELAYHDWYDWR